MISWTTIENAIRAWVISGTGLTSAQVIFANQGEEAPEGQYAAIYLTESSNGQPWLVNEYDEDGDPGEEITHYARNVSTVEVQIQIFGGAATGPTSGAALLNQLKGKTRLPTIHAALKLGGWAPATFDATQNISGVLGGSIFEPRASMTCRGSAGAEASELGTYIEFVQYRTTQGVISYVGGIPSRILVQGSAALKFAASVVTSVTTDGLHGAMGLAAMVFTAIAAVGTRMKATASASIAATAAATATALRKATGSAGTVFTSAASVTANRKAMGSMAFSFSGTAAAAVESAGYTLDTLTPADIATITGMPTPTGMIDCGVASGAEDLVGTDDLTDLTGFEDKEVVDATLGGETTGLATNTRGMVAASSAVLDIGAETITGIWIGRYTSHVSTTYTLGKRDAGGTNAGWEIYNISLGHVVCVADSATGATTRTISVEHATTDAQVIGFTRSIANNVHSVWSREGSAEGTRLAETLTNTAIFAIGKGRLAATLARHGKFIWWVGTDGDDFGEAQRLLLAQALGYEA